MSISTLHIVQHLAPGGLETLVLEMQARDPNCHVVSLEGDIETAVRNWPRLAQNSERLHFLTKRSGIRVETLFALRRLIARLNPSVIHTHHIGPMLYGGLAGRMTRKCRWVHTEHDAWHLENTQNARLVRGIATLLQPQLVADADAVASQLKARCGLNARTIRNGIDTEKFCAVDKKRARQKFSLPEVGTMIGTAGRLEPVKNQTLLLNAFKRCVSAPSLRLAIAGDGSLRADLEAHAHALGLAERVHFLGQVDHMPTFLSALDLFVLPSDKEGYPLSLLEAQACGVPVIATDVGGTREAICPITGTVFSAGDEAALSHLLDMFQYPKTSPRDFVLAEGSIEVMADAYHQVYAA